MDLRVVKTRNNIREVFLAMREKQPLEKIKVTQLCESALINKTTFYKHYQDIYVLSEEIENETIRFILDGFEQVSALFSDPDGFINGIYYAFKTHEKMLMTLFSGRMNVLFDKVEKLLMAQYPSLCEIPEKEIILSFLLRGATQVLSEPKYDETVLLETLSKVTRQILSMNELTGTD